MEHIHRQLDICVYTHETVVYFDRVTVVLGRDAVGHHWAVRLHTDNVQEDDHNLHACSVKRD